MTDTDKPVRTAEHVLDEEGHFHVEDAPIEFSRYLIEDWLSLGFFWLLGLCVFYQFFTRYVMNDSAAWTEEIARYLLMSTVFVGIAASVRRTRHIHVDFLYRTIPASAGRVLSREALMNRLRGRDLEAFDRSIDVHVSRIRAAIEDDPAAPRRILTVRGVGYVFAQRQDEGGPVGPS